MSYTLRRKMFKLGGPVNTHGVGITSNLKMNKGGKVVAGVGSGANPKVKGPDGKMREGHYFGTVINAALMGIPRAAQAARFMFNTPGGSNLVSKYGFKGAEKIMKEAQKVRSTKIGVPGTTMLGGNIQQAAMLANRAGAPLKMGFGRTRALAPLGIAGAGGLGAGMALTDRAGITKEGNDDSNMEKLLRGTGKVALDFLSTPGQLTYITQALRSSEKDPKQKSLFNLLADKKPVKSADREGVIDDEVEAMKTMTDKANARASEIYKMLGGGQQNKMLTASRALAAATPFVAEGEYGKAAAAAGESLAGSGEEDKKIAQEAALMTIEELKEEEQLKAGVVAQLMGAGEVETAVEAERAYEAGKQMGSMSAIKRLPLKSDGKHDTAATTTGVVYTDLTNVSGKLFIAYNSVEEPIFTNDYQIALNHSKD